MNPTRLQFIGTALLLFASLWLTLMWCKWLPAFAFLPKDQEPTIAFLAAMAGAFSFLYEWYLKAQKNTQSSNDIFAVLRSPFKQEIDVEKSRNALLSRMEKRCLDILPQKGNTIDLKFASALSLLAPRKSVERARREETALNNHSISNIFDLSDHRLLILGEPGAGKTTILYQLAQELCAIARLQPDRPIPLVINLSAWGRAEKETSVRDWLVDQMQVAYDIPNAIASAGIDGNYFCFLFDGFDEVSLDKIEQCAIAINEFAGNNYERQVCVCSRINEYELLHNKFSKLEYAVIIQPLTEEQIIGYFQTLDKFELAVAYEDSPTLQRVVNTPLMAEVAVMSSESMTEEAIFSWKEDEKKAKEQLWDAYLKYILGKKKDQEDQKTGNIQFANKDAVRWWIGWQAKMMGKFDLSILYLERMQPEILPKRQKVNFEIYTALLEGFAVGFAFSFLMPPFIAFVWSFFISLASIPINLYTNTKPQIIPFEQIDRSFSFQKTWESLAVGLTTGIIVGLLTAILRSFMSGYVIGAADGLALGSTVGITFCLNTFFRPRMVNEDDFQRPNEGINRSGKNAIFAAIPGVVLIAVAKIYEDQMHQPFFGRQDLHTHTLLEALGTLFIIFLSIRNGYVAFCGHYVLRYLLRKTDYIPHKYIPFLDYACRLGLLKRVGAGYTFYHRELREHIAARWKGGDIYE